MKLGLIYVFYIINVIRCQFTRICYAAVNIIRVVILVRAKNVFFQFSMISKTLLKVCCCESPWFANLVLLYVEVCLWGTCIAFSCNLSCCCPTVAADYACYSQYTSLVSILYGLEQSLSFEVTFANCHSRNSWGTVRQEIL